MSYPWKHLKPKERLTLRLERVISDQDVHVLTTLYQPLIGATSYALYMALSGSVNSTTEWKQEQSISSLLARLDIGIPEFYQARVRLEAMGLVKVFREKVNTDAYLYDIRPPLSATLFFQDNMMRLLLYEKVGERIYKELKAQFKSERPSTDDYEDITKSFLDVFHFDLQKYNRISQLEDDVPSFQKPSFSPSETITNNAEFDWDFFQNGLDKHFINKQSITKEIKELIYTFHTIYGVNELDMQRLLLEATDVGSGIINKNSFIRVVHRSYHKSDSQGVQLKDNVSESIEEMKTKGTLRHNTLKQQGFSKEEIEVIEHAAEVTPGEYLSSIKQQKGGFVTSNETWVLKELVEKSPLPAAVINILMNYILIIKDEAVFEKSFATKIANDWSQNDIDSPESAMQKVKQLYLDMANRQKQSGKRKNNYSKKSSKNGRKETLPNWAKEKSDQDEQVSTEEEQAFREKLQRIRQRKGGGS